MQGSLVFRRPIEHTLRGLRFERREEAKSFYLWVFFMPLCVPTDHITLDFGKRLGGDSHSWDSQSPDMLPGLLNAIREEAIPFLQGLETPEGVINRIRSLRLPPDAFYKHEAIGYLLARYGSVPEAIRSLDETIASLRSGYQPDWVKPLVDRAILLQDKLIEDPEAARHLLDSWEEESLRNLKLERFRGPAKDGDSGIRGPEVSPRSSL